MALQKQLVLPSGIIIEHSYHRIMDIRLNRDIVDGTDSSSAMAMIAIFKDSTARLENKPPIEYFNFTLPDGSYGAWFGISVLDQTNNNPFKNMYEYMKSNTNINGIDYTDATNV